MIERIWDYLKVRYIKLHFHLRMLEDTRLAVNKVSALRGGMGEMLLRANCIQDRNCAKCGFALECIVRRTMYSQFAIQPEFMHQGDSAGYVLECEDYEEEFPAGETLDFQLILFGKNIVYFHQYLQAFAYLGTEGLGKNKARFIIEAVTNTERKKLVEGSNVFKKNYRIRTIAEYVQYRLAFGQQENAVLFHTPVAVKYQGEMMEELAMEAIARRLYILDCFEGIAVDKPDISAHVPEIVSQSVRRVSVARYSSTHDEKIYLKGVCGAARLRDVDEWARILLYAGELMHIGKNTSFGFGRYSMVSEQKLNV